MKRVRITSTIETVSVILAMTTGAMWYVKRKKINQEIDEFDLAMRKLKADDEREDIINCCQIK